MSISFYHHMRLSFLRFMQIFQQVVDYWKQLEDDRVTYISNISHKGLSEFSSPAVPPRLFAMIQKSEPWRRVFKAIREEVMVIVC